MNKRNNQSKVIKRFIRNIIYNENKAYIDKLKAKMVKFEIDRIKETKDGYYYIN